MKNAIDIKDEARKLHQILKEMGIGKDITLTQAQEVISRQIGYRNRHEALTAELQNQKTLAAKKITPDCPLCLDTGVHSEIFAGFPPADRPPRLVACRCKNAQPTNLELASQVDKLNAELRDTRQEFNRVINFCLLSENSFEADTILSLWREGSWDSLEKEFSYPRPEFAKQGGIVN